MAAPSDSERSLGGKRRRTLVFPRSTSTDDEDRPSERPTKPTLPAIEASVIELSVSDFVTEALDSSPMPEQARLPTRSRDRSRDKARAAGVVGRAVATGVVLLAVVFAFLERRPPSLFAATLRAPRIASAERTPIAEPAAAALPVPPRGACVATGPARLVAPRAEIRPGLEVSPSETGFVVSFASTPAEAAAVRLEGSRLRGAETLRVRSAGPVHHVSARDAGEALEVSIDPDEGRTVPPVSDFPGLRIVPSGWGLVARAGAHTHPLWHLPRAPHARKQRRPAIDALRAAPRDEGGAVVAMKKKETLYLGLVSPSLAAEGPLTTITSGAVGIPSVSAYDGRGAVVWAQRDAGAHAWSVMLGTFDADSIETRLVGAGISPSIAWLANGDALVAYADGPAVAHRVVVRRFDHDLLPTGDLVVVSPQGVNAGQPVVSARADGSALVAWYAASRGQPASVYATPLACDPRR